MQLFFLTDLDLQLYAVMSILTMHVHASYFKSKLVYELNNYNITKIINKYTLKNHAILIAESSAVQV